jgi:hypothetical protein
MTRSSTSVALDPLRPVLTVTASLTLVRVREAKLVAVGILDHQPGEFGTVTVGWRGLYGEDSPVSSLRLRTSRRRWARRGRAMARP